MRQEQCQSQPRCSWALLGFLACGMWTGGFFCGLGAGRCAPDVKKAAVNPAPRKVVRRALVRPRSARPGPTASTFCYDIDTGEDVLCPSWVKRPGAVR